MSAATGRPPRDPLVSVWLGRLDGSVLHAEQEEHAHYAASTMKLPLAVAAYRLHERGALDLDAPVPVHNDHASVVAGRRFALDPGYDQDPPTWADLGTEVPLRELVRRAIVSSGNLATDLVIEHVGLPEVAAVLAEAGCSPATVVARGIEDAPGREAGLANMVTARDLGLLLTALADGRLAGPEATVAVEEVLAAQEHRDGIPAGLPAGTYVANKTGWIDGLDHDAALVRPEGEEPFVLVVLTDHDGDHEHGLGLVAATAARMWGLRRREGAG